MSNLDDRSFININNNAQEIIKKYRKLKDEFEENKKFLALDIYGLYMSLGEILGSDRNTMWVHNTKSTAFDRMELYLRDNHNHNDVCIFSHPMMPIYREGCDKKVMDRNQEFTLIDIASPIETRVPRTFNEGQVYVIYDFMIEKLRELYCNEFTIGRSAILIDVPKKEFEKDNAFLAEKYFFGYSFYESDYLIKNFIEWLVRTQIATRKYLTSEEMQKIAHEWMELFMEIPNPKAKVKKEQNQ